MLGSDPMRQYDNGLGTTRQGVVTLEPVYKFGGGDENWVKWFFKSFTDDTALGFNYTQAGQENSFTWDAMAKGFGIQMPLIAKLRDEHKVAGRNPGAIRALVSKNVPGYPGNIVYRVKGYRRQRPENSLVQQSLLPCQYALEQGR
jgi:hypothetical protein